MTQVSNIGMLRDYRSQLREVKAGASDAAGDALLAGAENVDPGSARTGGKERGGELE